MQCLEKKGYACILPEQFEDVAGQILREAPDLVLLDLNLPVQDGFYICQEVRKQTDVPVIVVTSSDSDMDELMSLHAGLMILSPNPTICMCFWPISLPCCTGLTEGNHPWS